MAEPQRTCVGCREVDDQSALQRYVLDGARVRLDHSRCAPGRGAWLHDRPQCREQALRRGGFARSFRRRVEFGQD